MTPTPAHSEAEVADLVEAWSMSGRRSASVDESRMIPLFRANASKNAHCVYPEMKRAAE